MVLISKYRGGAETGLPESWNHLPIRVLFSSLLLFFVLTRVPVASAHGRTAIAGLTQINSLVVLLFGGLVVIVSVLLKRTGRLTPTIALYGVFVGLSITILGAILFDGLSPDTTYSVSAMPFPRVWYEPVSLSVSLLILVGSLVLGWFRWSTKPRYILLGALMGMWIAYPFLIRGPTSDTHPFGYAIFFVTPLLVGYILWKDAGLVLGTILRDRVARRFGLSVGMLLGFFFVSVTGYLSFFPEPGLPHERVIVVLPTVYQLVTWPTLEIYLPHIPLFIAVSPGQFIVVGLLSVLIGLNATLIAWYWRIQEQAGVSSGAAGTVAVVGSCTCGCCGPLVAKIAALVAGPSIAAPLYWVFVDSASPLSAVFIVGSVVLFTGSLLYSIHSTRPSSQSVSITSAD